MSGERVTEMVGLLLTELQAFIRPSPSLGFPSADSLSFLPPFQLASEMFGLRPWMGKHSKFSSPRSFPLSLAVSTCSVPFSISLSLAPLPVLFDEKQASYLILMRLPRRKKEEVFLRSRLRGDVGNSSDGKKGLQSHVSDSLSVFSERFRPRRHFISSLQAEEDEEQRTSHFDKVEKDLAPRLSLMSFPREVNGDGTRFLKCSRRFI